MNIWVFAGGDKVTRISRMLPAPSDYAIAADSGLLVAQAHGVEVDLLVGDLDSTPPSAIAHAERTGAQVRKFDTDKDATDLELAFQAALEQNPTSITMIGGHGGRLDHFLANVDLLAALPLAASPLTAPHLADPPPVAPPLAASQLATPPADIQITAQMGSAIVHVVTNRVMFEGLAGQYVSLIPWGGDVEGVLARGLRWELDYETLKLGSSRGVSNELMGYEAMVSVKSGTLLVIHELEGLLV